jgi:DNA-binding NtrC family response regulator
MRASPGLSQHRVLVVEDETLIGLTLAGLLADEGFWVVGPVGSLAEGLFALDHASPDAVVLDLTLRDGMCAALAREIRARNIPFIVFSGYPRQDFGFPELHDVPWFEKPGNAEEIIRSLANLLAARVQADVRPACSADPAL